MDFKPLLLWSDILLWAMVAGCVALAFYCRRQDYLRRAWRRVGESGVAMASATVLAAFVIIGLLDSLHYQPRLPAQEGKPGVQYAPEVLSALDALVADLRLNKEKTYSAPLATHAFARETMERDGVQTRDYPRLQFGGAHLDDLTQHDSDLASRAVSGACCGLLLWAAIVGVAVGLIALVRGASYGAACRTAWRPGNCAEPAGRVARGIRDAGRAVRDRRHRGGLGRRVSRVRHRQGRAGRALPDAEGDAHRAADRHADHAS
jgi:peptide/nickel transport system permease protein